MIVDQVRAARRVSVPLVAVNTFDPAATMEKIDSGVNGESPKLQWDIVEGVRPRNEAAVQAMSQCVDPQETIMNPVGALTFAKGLGEGSMMFVLNAHRYLDDAAFVQAAWNLRDEFKQDRRMLVLLGCDIKLPPELSGDVVALEEPLPDQNGIADIVRSVHTDAGLVVNPETLPKAVAATTGLSAFQVEQLTAMSLTPDGLVLDDLWERKRRQIEQTPGLSVYRGAETFEDIGGCASAKDFMYRLCTGKNAPQGVFWIDEIDKQLAGEGDLSGVSQDQLGALLTYMEDMKARGLMFLGPPGCSKSLLAKAAGNEAGIPTVGVDMGAMKGSLVGQSETQMRNALKVVTSVSNGKPLFIATANSVAKLNTALLRRFPLTFYFDLPDREERAKIWPIHVQRCALNGEEIPNDNQWAGADIRNCCEMARDLSCPLDVAAKWVVPVGVRSAAEIEVLRQQANGRFLSAAHPGVYRTGREEKRAGGRQFEL
jgi:hypothetical protein